jgi:cobalt/nickel transport system permease protein
MPAEPLRSQLLLAASAAAIVALSAVADPRLLAAAGIVALLVFRRGASREALRVLRVVAPVAVGLPLASLAVLRLLGREAPVAPFVALALRALVIAFVTFSTLRRVDLLRALAPFPVASRLLVLTLAQIHALRRLATESALGLRSRLPFRPRTRDAVRGAGAVTASLLVLSERNARDAADALRSRGFS